MSVSLQPFLATCSINPIVGEKVLFLIFFFSNKNMYSNCYLNYYVVTKAYNLFVLICCNTLMKWSVLLFWMGTTRPNGWSMWKREWESLCWNEHSVLNIEVLYILANGEKAEHMLDTLDQCQKGKLQLFVCTCIWKYFCLMFVFCHMPSFLLIILQLMCGFLPHVHHSS